MTEDATTTATIDLLTHGQAVAVVIALNVALSGRLLSKAIETRNPTPVRDEYMSGYGVTMPFKSETSPYPTRG